MGDAAADNNQRDRLAFSATICDTVLVVLTVFTYLHASGSDFGAPEADVLVLGLANRVAVEVPTQGGLNSNKTH